MKQVNEAQNSSSVNCPRGPLSDRAAFREGKWKVETSSERAQIIEMVISIEAELAPGTTDRSSGPKIKNKEIVELPWSMGGVEGKVDEGGVVRKQIRTPID